MASGFDRKHGNYGNVHGFTAPSSTVKSGSVLGGLGTLVLYIIGALVLAQFALPVLASLGF